MNRASRACLLLLLSFNLTACAAESSRGRLPVVYTHEIRKDPNFSIHVVTIDLSDPRVSVRVSPGGPDPDGPQGQWLTTLLPVPEVADRDGYDIAVNGDFFGAQNTKDIEGKNTGYVRGKWAAPLGPAVSDGKLWAPNATTRPALMFDAQKRAVIMEVDPKKPFPSDAQQAIAGNVILVENGKVLKHKDQARHPRTAAGLSQDATKLILLVVDGRRKELSIGMTYEDLGNELVRLGAYTGVNLDGGGSTTLVLRQRGHAKAAVANRPSDGKPRSVADVLGIKVRGGLPTTKPSMN